MRRGTITVGTAMNTIEIDVENASRLNQGGEFQLLEQALTPGDISELKDACKTHLNREKSTPCYLFLDRQSEPIVEKVKAAVERIAGTRVYYLNDFYLYTDGTARTDWHVDNEMYTFGRAYNAWILLSPDEIPSPLAIMPGYNTSSDNHFHDIKADESGEKLVFTNLRNGSRSEATVAQIEAGKVAAPDVRVGDILVFDPGRFHKTNIESPKHIISFKFVAKTKDNDSFKSPMQVPGMFWPETKIFNDAIKASDSWSEVLDRIREALSTSKGREVLTAGCFPDRIELFREKVKTI